MSGNGMFSVFCILGVGVCWQRLGGRDDLRQSLVKAEQVVSSLQELADDGVLQVESVQQAGALINHHVADPQQTSRHTHVFPLFGNAIFSSGTPTPRELVHRVGHLSEHFVFHWVPANVGHCHLLR